MIWICANEFKKKSHGIHADLIFEIFSHYEEPAEWRGARISPSLRGASCTAWHKNCSVITRSQLYGVAQKLRGANEVSDVAIYFYSFTTVPPFIKRPVIISFLGSKFSGFSILLIRASAIARPIVSPFCSYVVSGGIIIDVRAIPS